MNMIINYFFNFLTQLDPSGMNAMRDISEFIDEFRSIVNIISAFLILIPALFNCFFGYKLLKINITLAGGLIGSIIGTIAGVFVVATVDLEPWVILIFLFVGMLIGGFIAFKLYKLGIFLQYFLLGTLAFAILLGLLGMRPFGTVLALSVVLGIIIGVLSVVLNKVFVIISSAIAGATCSASAIAMMSGINSVVQFFIAVLLAVLGIVVQFALEKKKGNNTSENVVFYPANANMVQPGQMVQPDQMVQPGRMVQPSQMIQPAPIVQEQFIFCGYCGFKMNSSFAFCPACGKETVHSEETEPVSTVPSANEVPATNAPDNGYVPVNTLDNGYVPVNEPLPQNGTVSMPDNGKSRKSGKKILIGSLIAVGVIAVLLVIGFKLIFGSPVFITNGYSDNNAVAEADNRPAGQMVDNEHEEVELIPVQNNVSGVDPSVWREAYADFLESCPDDYAMYGKACYADLFYIDGDDIPELIVETMENKHIYLSVYYYEGGRVKEGASFEVTKSDIYDDLSFLVYYYPQSDCISRAYCYAKDGSVIDYEEVNEDTMDYLMWESFSVTYYTKKGSELGHYHYSDLSNGSYFEQGGRLMFEAEKVRIDNLLGVDALIATLGRMNDIVVDVSEAADLSSAEVGDYVLYGSYEQDDASANGTEPVEWLVLDRQGDKVLLLSKYVLEIVCIEDEFVLESAYIDADSGQKEEIYDRCVNEVRNYLNDSFYNTAFNDAERQHIIPTLNIYSNISFGSNGAEYTNNVNLEAEDYVFLLSGQEADYYLGIDCPKYIFSGMYEEMTPLLCYPTPHVDAMARSVARDDMGMFPIVCGEAFHQNHDFDYSCSWNLRTGFDAAESIEPFIMLNNEAGGVDIGSTGQYSYYDNRQFYYKIYAVYGIRPAMWVSV